MTASQTDIFQGGTATIGRPPRLCLQQSKPHGIPCFGSVQKSEKTGSQGSSTHAYEGFYLHDTSEQEGHQGNQDCEDDKEY